MVDAGEGFMEETEVDSAAGGLRLEEFILRVLEVVGDDGGYCGVVLCVHEGDECGEGVFEVFTPEYLFVGVGGGDLGGVMVFFLGWCCGFLCSFGG